VIDQHPKSDDHFILESSLIADPPTNSQHCLLSDTASSPGRISFGRMGIECPIRDIGLNKKLKHWINAAR
jgi:hypothetical protein